MGTPCTTNQTTFTDPVLVTGDIVKDYHLNELKNAINRELTRRSNPNVDNITVGVGTVVKRSDWLAVVSRVDSLGTLYAWTSGIKTNTLIKATHVTEMRHNINLEEVKCTCDCNYCTCNCNYCTCNCNYCTCNCNYACTCNCNYSCACDCNYCTCNCNYACTCNCNYASDIRLKTEIRYF